MVTFPVVVLIAAFLRQTAAFISSYSRTNVVSTNQPKLSLNKDPNNHAKHLISARLVSLHSTLPHYDGCKGVTSSNSAEQKRRSFLFWSLEATTLLITSSTNLFPSVALAETSNDETSGDEFIYQRGQEKGDLTSRLFNPDGSLRDPNTNVEAKNRIISLSFSSPPSTGSNVFVCVSEDGAQPLGTAGTDRKVQTTYKVPTKWNDGQTLSDRPMYYDSSEGKNGKACNRITVYSVTAPKLDMSTLENASTVGIAKSLRMDIIPDNYFDQGVLKADLISGRTSRKPIKAISGKGEGEYGEQTYYEFDLAYAPLECPVFSAENLGLGFCPYDSIFLVSATVLPTESKSQLGTMMVCVVECNKEEWKIANSDLKRVRSSFSVERI